VWKLRQHERLQLGSRGDSRPRLSSEAKLRRDVGKDKFWEGMASAIPNRNEPRRL
jgi:hypothetical protein